MPSSELENENRPWRKMSLQELEKVCSPSRWSKRFSADDIIPAHIKSVTESSKASKAAVPNRLNIAYGPKPRMKLDVFGEDLPAESGMLVYVHGGYWQQLHKDISSYVVQPLYKSGIVTVVVGYDLAPQVTLKDIVSEVNVAVVWACDLARKRGSKGVVLSGHSAGGHLITEVLSTTEKGKELSKQKDIIRGAVPLSGVFDVRPLVQTYVNKPLELTESTAWTLSPMGKIGDFAQVLPHVKLLVAVGSCESPEFIRQSKEYFQKCVEAGLEASYEEVEAADHFSIVEDLAKADFSLTRKIIAFVMNCVTQK